MEKYIKPVYFFIPFVLIASFITNYYLFENKTAIEKGRKIEIQTQIAVQDKERTALQNAVWQAIDKGINERKTIEETTKKDDEKITIYVVTLSDSSLIELFTRQYGRIEKDK